MEKEIQQNIPPIQPLPQTSASVSTPTLTNWSKILLFTVLGLIVALGLVLIGIQIGKKQTPSQQPTIAQPTSSPTQTAVNPTAIPTNPVTATPAVDPTVNWKTYTETREVKFSIKYPTTWIVDTKDGMYGEKGARFDSDKEAIGSVGIGWNSQPVEPNCNTGTEKKELVQIKNRKIEMCHSTGSTQEPEGYFYNSTTNGVNYSIVTSNYPGEKNRQTILNILSTLEI